MIQLKIQLRELFWFMLLALSFLAPWTFLMVTLIKVQEIRQGSMEIIDGTTQISILMITWLSYRVTRNIVYKQNLKTAVA
jgi:hypothetical protein